MKQSQMMMLSSDAFFNNVNATYTQTWSQGHNMQGHGQGLDLQGQGQGLDLLGQEHDSRG